MPKKQASKAAQPSKKKLPPKTPIPPARPTPRKGKLPTAKKILKDRRKLDPPETPAAPVVPPAPLPEALPIFMRWTVTERTTESRSTGKTTHHASLCFDGTKVYTLEGPDAGDKLQHQADQWNAQEYIPKLDVHPGYFRSRPGVEAFLERGRGDKPFAT